MAGKIGQKGVSSLIPALARFRGSIAGLEPFSSAEAEG